MATYGVVWVTAESAATAKAIARALLEQKLAACVSIAPITSLYSWEGAIQEAEEWQLAIKTDLDYFKQITAAVKALHSYKVPELIALPIIQGSDSYFYWLSTVVEPQQVAIGQDFSAQQAATGEFVLAQVGGASYRFPAAGMAIASITPAMAARAIAYVQQWQAAHPEAALPLSFAATWQEAEDYFGAIEGIDEGKKG